MAAGRQREKLPAQRNLRPNESKAGNAFEWPTCVQAFSDKHIEHVAKWRGFSLEFLLELRDAGLIGIFNGLVAFPVHDRAGNIVAAHYRLKDGSWRYFPQGTKMRPLVIGELAAGDPYNVFESYWDALALHGQVRRARRHHHHTRRK